MGSRDAWGGTTIEVYPKARTRPRLIARGSTISLQKLSPERVLPDVAKAMRPISELRNLEARLLLFLSCHRSLSLGSHFGREPLRLCLINSCTDHFFGLLNLLAHRAADSITGLAHDLFFGFGRWN